MLGNFVNGSPSGTGKVLWKNGDTCSGEISGNLCKGTKVDAAGTETKGSFEWKLSHEDHSFSFGNYSLISFNEGIHSFQSTSCSG